MTRDDSSEDHRNADRGAEGAGLVLPPPERRWRPGARAILFAGVAGACALGVGLGLWARPDPHERGIAVAQAAADTPDPQPAGRKLQIVIGDRPAPVGAPIEVLPQAPRSLFAALTPAPHPNAARAAVPAPAPVLASATSPAPASHPDILPRLAPLMTAALAAPRLFVEKIKAVEPPVFAQAQTDRAKAEPPTVRRTPMFEADARATRLAVMRLAAEKAAAQADADQAAAHRMELAQAAEAKAAQAKAQQARLAEAKLVEARLEAVKLADAKAAQAKLTQAKLTQAKLAQSKLAQSKLAQSKLAQAKLTQAKLAKAAEARQAQQIRLAQAAQEKAAEAKAEKAEAIRLAKAEKSQALRLAQAEAKGRAEAQVEAKAMVLAEARDEAKKRARLEALVHAVQKALPHMAPAPVETAKLDARRAARSRHDEAVVERASLKARKSPHPAEPPARSRPAPVVPAPPSGLVKVSAPRCASRDPGEALVCADPSLGAADRQLTRAYQGARAAGVPEAQLQRQQQQWLAARSAAAREAPWAVRDVYLARIAELNGLAKDAHGDGY
ncbi:pentapeptide repeat-containing protein [Phenylobacterium sp.]|uniref:pentapeptide repeat-containing protein n=1 Tax=Phenylobacterium sp. TaxID=1871053 RepID=UPI0011F71B57|nr:pentapeptide repeat-containing protein [Phenylobacterium sp.]THD57745.1 MAG: hypothetical protein E8A49_21290 [Phenylobacterium sp.]